MKPFAIKTRAKRPAPKPRSETSIQIDIVDYLRKVLPPSAIVHHSKNEGNRGGRKGLMDGVRAKKMGVAAGFPDIAVYASGKRVLFLEVKKDEQETVGDKNNRMVIHLVAGEFPCPVFVHI